ncbi:MAG: SGNH/GDSL hydrolase family protein [Prevotellaceae bacterium]|nr:SGNH/GDSL hydrolase family protein [Prevotellaceae bacterium]
MKSEFMKKISINDGSGDKIPIPVDNLDYGDNFTFSSITNTKFLGTWCSLGTSITWYDTNGRIGYQTRVQRKIHFDGYINLGKSGYTIQMFVNEFLDSIPIARYYTIEFGINDFLFGGMDGKRNGTPIGSVEDFKNGTGVETFYGAYRMIIDKIYSLNPDALIIVCSTTQGEGGATRWEQKIWARNPTGHTIMDYANAAYEIAKLCSFPFCDFFGLSGINKWTLERKTHDKLHPNGFGYEGMADVLISTFLSIPNINLIKT